MVGEYNGSPSEPIMWKLLEALLVNVLVLISVVVVLVSMVWDWICSFIPSRK